MLANKAVPAHLSVAVICAVIAGCGGNAIEGQAKSAPTTRSFAATTTTTTTAPTTPPGQHGSKHWFELVAGECIQDLPAAGTTFTYLDTVDCGASHDAEVFAAPTVAGETDVDAAAERECGVAFTEYVGVPVEQSEYTFNWLTAVNPSNAMSAHAVCLLFRPDETPMVGSAHA